MCGFVGIAGDGATVELIDAMLDRLRHRGPDGRGHHIAPGFAVGHVRLAIVELTSAGAQPMHSPDGRYCLAYNGELYNHADFRPQLEARGIQFRGHSDTETLLWLLIEYGERILPELNGIFAFVFYDSVENKVLLARDHMGVKPLYYARGNRGRLVFGSEIKALFAARDIEPRANTADLLELYMFHFIAGERTAFADVFELLPGHFLRYQDGHAKVIEYWDPIAEAQLGTNESDERELRALLEAAVHRQLMSDVPLGVMSSAGLDSGIVTAFGARRDSPMHGFCYRDPPHYDELDDARLLARGFGVEVHEVRIAESEVPDLLTKLTWHYDEPLPRPHHLAAYAVAREANRHGLKVLLSGEGGDELFGGYMRYVEVTEAMSRSGDLSPLVFGHNRVALPRIARFMPARRFSNAYRFWCAEETQGFDLVNRQLLVDQRTFLQHFLQRSDRMGMAASIENRVPLLDIPLVTYVNRLRGSAKVSGTRTKACFKDAIRDVLPATLLDRNKQGFEMPMASLLRSGPVASYVDDVLLSKPRCNALFDARAVAKLVNDFRAGEDDLWKIIWLLVATETWMRAFDVLV